jgi:hypothetical protein
MTIPLFVLLAFAVWTLLTLFGSIGVYRWNRIRTGHASLAEWRAEGHREGIGISALCAPT